jgi:nicotinamide mononucleotide transporter
MIHALDITGSIFSFLSTLFYVLASVWAWPIGIVATLINGSLYGITGIYGDMSLEVIYFISMFYGWYQWRRGGKQHKALPVTRLTPNLSGILAAIGVGGTVVAYFILKNYTNSHVPALDASTTAFSLIAQWMTCKKILECWMVWFCVDAVYVGLYIYKGIPFHSVLLFVYLGMAIAGYIRWYQLKKESAHG